MCQQASPDDGLRIWVPGCATGEEAYSLAILFQEYLNTTNTRLDVKIFATDVHRTVDDRPFGGGPGMVMKAAPLARAIAAAKGRLPAGSPVIGLSAQGAPFDQATARLLRVLRSE